MAAGILAGALGGAGKAIQWNAQGQIEDKRQRALMALEQEMAMERQDDQQAFTRGENERNRTFQRSERLEGQEFTAGQKAQDRQLSRWQTRVQQAGATERATAGRNDWQLVPLQGGGYGRYNTRTGDYEDANLPDGAQPGGGGLTDRQQAQLDVLGDRAKSLRDKQADGIPLSPEEKTQLGQIETQMNAIINPDARGGSLADDVAADLAGEEPAGSTAAPAAQGGQQGGQPGQGGDNSTRGIIARQRGEQADYLEQRDAQAAADAARDEADAVIDEIYRERTGGYSSPVMQDQFLSQNGGTAEISQETIERAQAAADQLLEASRSELVSDDQRRWIADRIIQLQDLGVPINLDDQE